MGRQVDSEGLGLDWRALLRGRGYRLTQQRELVLEAVAELGHATPDEVTVAVQQRAPAVSASTVYRTLELLEELGLVRHTHLGHRAPTWSVATEDEHVHLVCRACGGVEEVDTALVADLVALLESDRGFRADVAHLAVSGRCRNCSEEPMNGVRRSPSG